MMTKNEKTILFKKLLKILELDKHTNAYCEKDKRKFVAKISWDPLINLLDALHAFKVFQQKRPKTILKIIISNYGTDVIILKRTFWGSKQHINSSKSQEDLSILIIKTIVDFYEKYK